MDEGTAEIIRRSGVNSAPTIIGAIGALIIGLFVILAASAQIGWGQPDANGIVSSVVEDNPEIVFTNDYRNCGGTNHIGGCFSIKTPDTLYISPNLPYSTMKYIVLHELAHYEQYKTGAKLDECDADSRALDWGADISKSGYVAECPDNNYG